MEALSESSPGELMKALGDVAVRLASFPAKVEGRLHGHGRQMMATLAVSILCHFHRANIPFPMTLFKSKAVSREEADAARAEAAQLVKGALPGKK